MTPTLASALAIVAFAAAAAPAGDPPDLVQRFDRPPAVTASFKNEPVEKALAELGRQAGCRVFPVEGGRGKGATVTLEVKDLSYWAAVDLVAEKAGLVLTGSAFEDPPGESMRFGSMDGLKLVKAEKGLLRAAPSYGGPARAALVSVVAERSGKIVNRFSSEAEQAEAEKATLRVGLKFAALDGFELAEGVLLRVDAAVDEKGKKLAPVEGGGSGYGMTVNGISGERWVVFDGAGGYGERLAEFAGALEVLLPRGEETVEMDLAALPATAKIGGTTLTVKEVGDGTMKIEAKGSLFPPAKGADAKSPDLKVLAGEKGEEETFFRPRLADVRLLLRDAEGKVVTSSGWGGGGDGETITFEYQLSGRPAKITVRATAKVEKREIPFRFAGIPLPR